MDNSNTEIKQTKRSPIPNAKPFVKGDPRINRKGRPKTFDELRKLAQEIAHQKKEGSDNRTIAEWILEKMAKDPRLMTTFLEIAFGKVPNINQITGVDGGAIASNVHVNFSALSDGDLKTLLDIESKAVVDAPTE